MRDINYKEAEEHSVQYVLNAMFFCFWVWEVRVNRILGKYITAGVNRLVKFVTSKRIYEKVMANQKASAPLMEDLFFNPKQSFTIQGAYRMGLCFIPWTYCTGLNFIIMALLLKHYEYIVNKFTIILITAIPIFLAIGLMDRYTLKDDRYLRYFKLFERMDKKWHRKWNTITLCFCILGIAWGAGGFFLMIHILSSV